ncbi:MAG TPA: hypothetical protein VM240_09855 [Verrucomicrobiae bacterium]|nr:hypothetical protein [Verrucomicrobiae bacterium]
MTKHQTLAALCTTILAGCASTPAVTLNYYGVKWNAMATVTQTVGCNADKTRLIAIPAVSVATTYSSDLSKPRQIDIKKLDGLFSDADFAMTLTEDGRLKTINQSSTGQGEAIVKSAVGLLAVAGIPKHLALDTKPLAECDLIEKWGGGKAPVTLLYKANIDEAKLGQPGQPIDAAPESKPLYDLLKAKLPKITMDVGRSSEVASRPVYSSASSNVVLLELQKTGLVDITVQQDSAPIGGARLIIPTSGIYNVPIPKAALFGKQGFTLALSDAGVVTSIGYVKTAGTAGALNALASIAGMETSTAAAKAAELKAQADLIAQQQRLVLCETKPADCK